MDQGEIISYNFNSNFRSNGLVSEPEFILPDSIENIHSVKVRNLMIPLSTPVFDTRNNKFYFRETTSGSILTAILTSGNYISSGTNANSITSQLKSALESASTLTWTYTVSVNPINNRITISTTNGNFSLTSGVNDCYYELGYNSDNLNSFALSHTGNETIDLSGVKIIHISSSIQCKDLEWSKTK